MGEGGDRRWQMRADWRARLAAHLSSHHGIVSVRDAPDLGVHRRQLFREVEAGRLVVMAPGVMRSSHWPLGLDQQMTAACVRNPAVLIGLTSAAALWKMRRVPRPPAILVLVPHGSSPQIDGVIVHRCRRIDPVDIVQREDGIRLTSPPRTIFDSADMLGFDATASVLEQLIDDGRGTFETHLATWTRLAHPRRPGSRTMARVLGSRPAWREALQSDLEATVLTAIVSAGLPTPHTQWPLLLADGRRIRLDFAWPELRLALEVDHPFWHAGAEESQRDRGRDRALMAGGWVVPRNTSMDVANDLHTAIAQVAAILLGRHAA